MGTQTSTPDKNPDALSNENKLDININQEVNQFTDADKDQQPMEQKVNQVSTIQISQFSKDQYNALQQSNQKKFQYPSKFITIDDNVSISKKFEKKQDIKKKFKLMSELIKQISNNSDVEIKITNLNPCLNEQLPKFLKELSSSGQQVKVENKQNSEILPNVFQVEGQIENNISKQDKMILLYIYHHQYFTSEETYERISINVSKCEFHLNSHLFQDQNKRYFFFKDFKWLMDNTVILNEFTKTNQSAQFISQFLNKQNLQDKLKHHLNIDHLLIFPSYSLLKEIQNPSLRQIAQAIVQSNPQIIIIGLNIQKQKINSLQDKLSLFIRKNINVSTKICQIQTCIEPTSQKLIDTNIQQILSQYDATCEVITTSAKYDPKVQKFVAEIQFQYWFDYSQSQNVIDQKIKTLKNKIEAIYVPMDEIALISFEQVKIWQNFLSNHFESQKQNKECKTKYKNDNSAKIELKGELQEILKTKAQIVEALSTHEFTTIQLEGNTQIFQILSEKLPIQNLFKRILQELAKPYGKALFKIQDIKLKQYMSIKIYQQKNQEQDSDIENYLQKQFIKQLVIFYPKIDVLELYNYLKLNENSFLEKYEIYPHRAQDTKKCLFVGLSSAMFEMSEIVEQLIEDKNSNIDTFSFTCSNKLILNSLIKFMQKREDDFQKIIGRDEKIFFMAEKSKMKSLISELQQQHENLTTSIVDTDSEFSEKEVKFLSKHGKAFLDQLEQENEINISVLSNEKNVENSTATKLEYQGKALFIQYADISKFSCDAIVNSCNERMTFGHSSVLS